MKLALSKALRRVAMRKEVIAQAGAAETCKSLANRLQLAANSLGDHYFIQNSNAYRAAADAYKKYTGEAWVEPSGLAKVADVLRG